MDDTYCEIRKVKSHYELYIDNEFICSGDTYEECLEELQNYNKKE